MFRNARPCCYGFQLIGAGLLVLGVPGGTVCSAEEVWIKTIAATWSENTAWLDGTAPAAGGDPTLAMVFRVDGRNSGVTNSFNDLAGAFKLNRLTFDSDFPEGF